MQIHFQKNTEILISYEPHTKHIPDFWILHSLIGRPAWHRPTREQRLIPMVVPDSSPGCVIVSVDRWVVCKYMGQVHMTSSMGHLNI